MLTGSDDLSETRIHLAIAWTGKRLSVIYWIGNNVDYTSVFYHFYRRQLHKIIIKPVFQLRCHWGSSLSRPGAKKIVTWNFTCFFYFPKEFVIFYWIVSSVPNLTRNFIRNIKIKGKVYKKKQVTNNRYRPIPVNREQFPECKQHFRAAQSHWAAASVNGRTAALRWRP